MSQKLYKSSGKKSFIDALSIMDTELTPPQMTQEMHLHLNLQEREINQKHQNLKRR